MARYAEMYWKELEARELAERKAKLEQEGAEMLREYIRARNLEDAFMRWLLVKYGQDDILSTSRVMAKDGGGADATT